jgi:L-amino acid N-acyltransferase YncA
MAVVIRLAAEEDAATIAAIYRPYVEDSRISFEEIAPSAEEMASRLKSELYPWYVASEAGGILGYASSSAFRTRPAYRWTVETGIYLAPEAQGRGIGRELLSRQLQLLTRQGFVSAVGAITLPNDASVALHEKLGFTRSGTYRKIGFKLGAWLDVGLWQRDLAPRSESPQEPLPFRELTA